MVTLKFIGGPWHPLSVGMTEIVPTIFAFVAFAGAIHDVIFPMPLVARPIAEFVLFQAYEEPEGKLMKLGIDIMLPGQAVIFRIWLTVGVG